MEQLFTSIGRSDFLFRKVSVKVFDLFFFWFVFFLIDLWILTLTFGCMYCRCPPTQVCGLSLFTFFNDIFWWPVLNFNLIGFTIFPLRICAFVMLKKSLHTLKWWIYLALFSSESLFCILFTFKSSSRIYSFGTATGRVQFHFSVWGAGCPSMDFDQFTPLTDVQSHMCQRSCHLCGVCFWALCSVPLIHIPLS